MSAVESTQGLRLYEAAHWWPCSEKTLRRLVERGLVRARRQTDSPNSPLTFYLNELIEDRRNVDAMAGGGEVLPTVAVTGPQTLEEARVELRLLERAAA